MVRRRHTPEQIIRKLAEGHKLLAGGQTVEEVCRQFGIAESTWARWLNQYGGMKANDAKRLRELESEGVVEVFEAHDPSGREAPVACAPDHRLQVLRRRTVIAVRFADCDEGEAVVFVPFTIHRLVVESRGAALVFLCGDERLDLVIGDLEHSSPHRVARVPRQCCRRADGLGRHEFQLRLRVVGREEEPGAWGDLCDSCRIEQ